MADSDEEYHDTLRADTVKRTPPIVVDTNAGEIPLYAALSAKFGSDVVRKRLDVGDVVLSSPDSDRTIVIERKTWLDFGASLRDGRYSDQKARLLADGEVSTATIVYLVEGHLRGWHGTVGPANVPNASIEAAIVKTTLRDKISVLRTKDTAHSAALIGYLHEQLTSGALFEPTKTASGVGSKRRRDNAQDPWQTMLHSLPGMSAAKAVAVATAYPSMRAIGQAEESELASLVVLAEGKKPRKLGPVLAKVLARLN